MKGTLFAIAILAATVSFAQVNAKELDYKEGATALQGYLAAKPGTEKRPGILIVHDWTGIDDYERGRTKQLADMGFIALAVDIYGKDVKPTNPKEYTEQVMKYVGDRALFKRRLLAGLEALKADPRVDPTRIVAIGYCFGGTGVLELARSGADVKGVVSFHGNLGTQKPEEAKDIKAKILVCHGADDPFVPEDDVKAFWKEMRDAKVDWQFIAYANAVHAFTEPNVGNDNSMGAAYNEKADKRSWEHMKEFFQEVIGLG